MVYIVVILVVLVADLIIKAKILEIPEAGFPIEKFKGKVKIVRTFNEGMAANVLDEDPAKVKKISSLVLVIFLILSLPLFFSKKGRINRKLGAALIIGGALSNVADRCTAPAAPFPAPLRPIWPKGTTSPPRWSGPKPTFPAACPPCSTSATAPAP